MRHQARRGLTLVEVLITMSVLAIVLIVGTAFLTSTGRITNRHGQLAAAAGDARLALFRISEVTRQAGYIYPPGIQITVSGQGTFTTGDGALALLVPAGTTYCTGTGSRYCGFIYFVGNRSQFVPPLPAEGATNMALGEIRVAGMEWPKSVVPALSIRTWSSGSLGLLADGVVADETSLGDDVRISTLEAIYDDAFQFRYATETLQDRSLLNGVRVELELRKNALGGDADSVQSVELFTRAVPRSAPANLD